MLLVQRGFIRRDVVFHFGYPGGLLRGNLVGAFNEVESEKYPPI